MRILYANASTVSRCTVVLFCVFVVVGGGATAVMYDTGTSTGDCVDCVMSVVPRAAFVFVRAVFSGQIRARANDRVNNNAKHNKQQLS